MTVCDKTLFVAGFPDQVAPKDPWGGVEGRLGGVLCALQADDGRLLAEYTLDSPPVWNGVAAANARLYLSTRDGRVVCFAGNRP